METDSGIGIGGTADCIHQSGTVVDIWQGEKTAAKKKGLTI
jgi:hypothetical protein